MKNYYRIMPGPKRIHELISIKTPYNHPYSATFAIPTE